MACGFPAAGNSGNILELLPKGLLWRRACPGGLPRVKSPEYRSILSANRQEGGNVRNLAFVILAAVLVASGCGKAPGVVVELRAPAEIQAGSLFDITWTGPDSVGDYVTIVPAGSPEGDWADYGYTRDGNPITLTAPFTPGSYEIRYATERTNPDSTLGRITVTITPASASVTAPSQVAGGNSFDVAWTGPDGNGIYLVLVPQGTAEGEWVGWEWHYVSEGNPIPFLAPSFAGAYEIRLATEATDPDSTLAMFALNVTGADISVTAPATAAANADFLVSWTGPNNTGDYITIVPDGSAEGDWAEYAYTSEGNPVTLAAPAEPGTYEIRYANEIPNPDVTLARTLIEIQ
jgi:Ca-activated chloride channel homolog